MLSRGPDMHVFATNAQSFPLVSRPWLPSTVCALISLRRLARSGSLPVLRAARHCQLLLIAQRLSRRCARGITARADVIKI